MDATLIATIVVAAVALATLLSGFRVINEYERGVVFRLGKFDRVVTPGPCLIVPFGVEHLVRVDARTTVTAIPLQEINTADNFTVRVLPTMQSQVIDPRLAVTKVANHQAASVQVVQATVRSVVSRVALHVLLTARSFVDDTVQRLVDRETEPWGVKVSAVEINDIQLLTPSTEH